jgi:hypothetical protein
MLLLKPHVLVLDLVDLTFLLATKLLGLIVDFL